MYCIHSAKMSYSVQNRVYAENAKLYDDRIIFYNSEITGNQFVREKDHNNNKTNNKKYQGHMTRSGKKIIENRLTAWFNSIDVYNYLRIGSGAIRAHLPIMVTLTLSDQLKVDHRYIKRKLLQNFIKYLQYNFNITHYFWKAELQGNGNLHFHLLFDRYIPMKKIQEAWNHIQHQQSYLDKYYNVHGHYNAPSTHVISVYKSNNKVQYMMKYVSKKEVKAKIDGAVYRFSKGLIKCKPFAYINEGEYSEMTEKLLRDNPHFLVNYDWSCSAYMKKNINVRMLEGSLKNKYIDYYLNLYSQLYN